VSALAAEIHHYPVRWVKLERYCELTGDTEEAVRGRRARGEWLDGRHVRLRKRRLWVNLPEADKWVENNK
jgi:hypothetical protein